MTDRDERIINIANQIGELLAKHRNQDEALTGLGCYIGVVCHRGDADLPYWIAAYTHGLRMPLKCAVLERSVRSLTFTDRVCGIDTI